MSAETPPRLTSGQWTALRVAADTGRSYSSRKDLCATSGECAGLVRRGLLLSVGQSERVRGERTFHSRLYVITTVGRAVDAARRQRESPT